MKGKKSSLAYFKVFRAKYFIHVNYKTNLDKFDAKSDQGFFLGYFDHYRAYRVFNLKNDYIEESPHVNFDELNDITENLSCSDEDKAEILEEKIEKGNQQIEIVQEE